MSLENCSCAEGLGQLGTPNCIKTFGGFHKIIFTNLKGSDGSLNKIDAADVALTQSYIDGKVQSLVGADRWNFSPEVTDFKPAKEDPDIKEFDDKKRVIIEEGRRSFTGLFVDADPVFKAYLDKVTCVQTGFFVVSDKGNVMGMKKDETGDVYPIPLDLFYSKQGFRRGENDVQVVSFMMDIPLIVRDTQLSMIYSVSTTGDLVTQEGIYKLSASLGNATTSSLDITLIDGGSFGGSEPYTGLEATDLSAYDVTAAASGTVASVTDNGNGVWTVAFTGATSGNTMRLSATALLLAKGFIFDDVSEALA